MDDELDQEPAPEMAEQEAPEAPAPEAGAPPKGGDAMEKVTLAAMKVLYDPKTSDGVVKMLQSGQPAQALAQTALFVMGSLIQKSNGMPKAVVAPAAEHIVGLLSELAQAAGVKMGEQDNATALQMVQQKIQQMMAAKPEELAAAAQQQGQPGMAAPGAAPPGAAPPAAPGGLVRGATGGY